MLLQSRVTAVPDPRTNSIVVNAARETMTQIAETIGRLDATDAKKQHVVVHRLENGDAENVVGVLRGMFSDSSTTTSSAQTAGGRLQARAATGASADAANAMNSTSSGGRSAP